MANEFKGTTICAVKKNGLTAIAGDGQVTFGENVVFKNNAVKVRRIYNDSMLDFELKEIIKEVSPNL